MTPARLAANISGTPSKGRIYALHGVTDNAASLSDISARWSNDYEVVLIDALGHGCSSRFTPTQLEDPFEALVRSAASLICTIEEASPAPFVALLGHSMGGATAADIVSRGLAPVDALVLEDPALLTPSQREHFRASAEDRVARCDEVTQWMGARHRHPPQGLPPVESFRGRRLGSRKSPSRPQLPCPRSRERKPKPRRNPRPNFGANTAHDRRWRRRADRARRD